MDPATVDEQFEEIVRNTTSPASIPLHPLTADFAARILVLTSFTAAVFLFEVPSVFVALIAVGLVALAAGEAIVERRQPVVATTTSVRV